MAWRWAKSIGCGRMIDVSVIALVEKIVDGLRHLRADAVHGLQILGAGARHGLGRAEMLEQRPLARRADAGDLVERIGADAPWRAWRDACRWRSGAPRHATAARNRAQGRAARASSTCHGRACGNARGRRRGRDPWRRRSAPRRDAELAQHLLRDAELAAGRRRSAPGPAGPGTPRQVGVLGSSASARSMPNARRSAALAGRRAARRRPAHCRRRRVDRRRLSGGAHAASRIRHRSERCSLRLAVAPSRMTGLRPGLRFIQHQPPEAARQHLAHHGVVVAGRQVGRLDVELAVLALHEAVRRRPRSWRRPRWCPGCGCCRTPRCGAA